MPTHPPFGFRPQLLQSLPIAVLMVLLLIPALVSIRGFSAAARDRNAATAALGMTVAKPETAGEPLLVTSLRADGPADRAGMAVGDEIDRIDGRRPSTLRQAEHQLAAAPAPHLTIRRHGRDMQMVIPRKGRPHRRRAARPRGGGMNWLCVSPASQRDPRANCLSSL